MTIRFVTARRVADALKAQKAERVVQAACEVTFTAAQFWRVSHNILVPITAGRIVLRAGEGRTVATYALKFTYLLLMTSMLVSLASVAVAFITRQPSAALAYGVSAHLVLVAANIAITAVRFPKWLRAAMVR